MSHEIEITKKRRKILNWISFSLRSACDPSSISIADAGWHWLHADDSLFNFLCRDFHIFSLSDWTQLIIWSAEKWKFSASTLSLKTVKSSARNHHHQGGPCSLQPTANTIKLRKNKSSLQNFRICKSQNRFLTLISCSALFSDLISFESCR